MQAAKYISASISVHEIQWLTNLTNEILSKPVGNAELRVDNNEEIAVMNAAGPTKISKYINIRYHYV